MSQIYKSAASGGGVVTSVTGTNGVTASPTTGAVVVSGVNATTSTVGVASFNPAEFTVTAGGAVSLVGGPAEPVIQTLSDDIGTIVNPSASGNIQLVGHVFNQSGKFSTIVAGTNLENINPMSVARWIVDARGFNGTHTTIQAAINAATSGDTIAIMDGVYTENPILKAGLSLVSFDADGFDANVTIVGKVQADFSGNISLCGINLKTNGDYCLEVTGSSACIVRLVNCQIEASNNTAIHFTTTSGSSRVELFSCFGNLDTTGISYFTFSGTGAIRIVGGEYDNNGGSTTACTMSSGGAVSIVNCFFNSPITTSGSAILSCSNSSLKGILTLGGSGVMDFQTVR